MALETVLVAEERVAELDKGEVEVGAVEVGRGGAVDDEFAQLLGEAAADLEIFLAAGYALLDFVVARGPVDFNVEELERADAWIRKLS